LEGWDCRHHTGWLTPAGESAQGTGGRQGGDATYCAAPLRRIHDPEASTRPTAAHSPAAPPSDSTLTRARVIATAVVDHLRRMPAPSTARTLVQVVEDEAVAPGDDRPRERAVGGHERQLEEAAPIGGTRKKRERKRGARGSGGDEWDGAPVWPTRSLRTAGCAAPATGAPASARCRSSSSQT
jgi:hypothetical protein